MAVHTPHLFSPVPTYGGGCRGSGHPRYEVDSVWGSGVCTEDQSLIKWCPRLDPEFAAIISYSLGRTSVDTMFLDR